MRIDRGGIDVGMCECMEEGWGDGTAVGGVADGRGGKGRGGICRRGEWLGCCRFVGDGWMVIWRENGAEGWLRGSCKSEGVRRWGGGGFDSEG
jgi:hypothetical protein